MIRAFLVALAATAGPAIAGAPEVSPLPVPRDLTEADVHLVRVETLTPERPSGAEAPADLIEPPVVEVLAEDDAEFLGCLADLNELGTVFEDAEPVTAEDPDCGIVRPLSVSEIVPGVTVRPDALMRCDTARALATWVDGFVLPASRMLPERGEVVAIDHGSAYVCRRRNNAPDGRLSEHSFGKAIDVTGFRFAKGPPIPVQPREREGTTAEAFQDAVRATACLTFTTVLGPGSDEAHADHLHLDVKERPGGFRLCQ